MSKFNTTATRNRSFSPLQAQSQPSGTTYEGHPGYARDVKSELFLLAVSNMVGENTFYEASGDRDDRYTTLIHQATVHDPEWTANLLRWLRSDGNMRSASLVGAAEFTRIAVANNITGARHVVNSVLQRADEPGEILAYWTSRYGRTIPKPLKRGIADATLRLYTERSFLKYDTSTRGFRFGDVIDLVHPATTPQWQNNLFEHALDRRHQRNNPIPVSLRVLQARAVLMALPIDQRRTRLDPVVLADAGMTWESVAGWLHGPMDALAWEAVIPSMGYMALLRNLRNFDSAGVSDDVADRVAVKLADAGEVARSRQLPFRWFSAYREVVSDRWRVALGKALDGGVRNIPEIPGRTLILVDTSASMSSMGLSARSTVRPVDAAALFGVALGMRCGPANVTLCGFASGVFEHSLSVGGSVLRQVELFANRIGEVGHGTDTAAAVHATYRGHDRVVILSDEQSFGGRNVADQVPETIPMYAFNLGGYKHSMLPGVLNRHQLGGLTDHTFKIIPLLEAGTNGTYPWVNAN